MDRKIITTLRLHRCLGLICSDCPLKGQGMNQKQFCSFYRKSHDEARPKFCKVENIEITEGLELPEPVKYNRDNEPVGPETERELRAKIKALQEALGKERAVPEPTITTIEIHELCHNLLCSRGIHGEIHVEIERGILAWLEGKRITVIK